MKQFFGAAGRAARRAWRRFILGPLGHGRPFAAGEWDEQYRTGKWRYLESLDQMAHYAVIAGYVRRLCPSGTILELGCGTGLLLRELEGLPIARYTGVDLSEEALLQARELAAEAAPSIPWDFQIGDFDRYTPDERVDLVIFAESLYYAARPLDVLERFRPFIRNGGTMIVSMYRYRNTATIWRRIGRRFPVLSSTRVENARGQEWDVRVLGASE